jgi:hypothetical protein
MIRESNLRRMAVVVRLYYRGTMLETFDSRMDYVRKLRCWGLRFGRVVYVLVPALCARWLAGAQ